ncbi:MAG: SET domain-containing protein [Planctomycetota bacterium]
MTTIGSEVSAPAGLRVGRSPGRGRGVFATRGFAAGEVIERAAVIVFPRADVRSLQGTLLDSYWFWWDEACNAAALGCGSLYNHAAPANARFARDVEAPALVFLAARPIAVGEEITINYGGEPDDPSPTWFEVQ